MTEIIKSYTTRQYPANALSDSGTYSDNNLTYTSTITNGIDISGTQYGGGNCIVKYSSYKTDTDNNLIVHYKFDDNSTNMLLDSTSNGNNLTNYNTTFDNTNYKIGNGSVYFNGNSQYIEMPSTINPYTIWNNNGISFSIWFNMSSTASPNCRIIDFSSDNIGTTPTNYILIYKDGTQTDKINIVIVAPNGANTYLSPTLNSNTWHHIVWTISSSGVWGLYINNVYINPGITQGIPNVTWTRRWLGRSSSDSDPYYIGNMDDFRIYNKVITESEVNTIYNNIISGTPVQLPPYMTNFSTTINNIIYRACAYDYFPYTVNGIIYDFFAWQAFDISNSRYVSQSNFNGDGTLSISGVTFGNDINYRGVYIGIDMGQKINMKSYYIKKGFSPNNTNNRNPKNWKIYATNNDACWNSNGGYNSKGSLNTSSAYDWVEIDIRSNETTYIDTTVFTLNSNNFYRYYALHVNAIISGDQNGGFLDISKWDIFGIQTLSIPKPWIIFKNDPAYYKKIDISSSEPNWNGNYDTVSPYSYMNVSTYLLNNFTGEYITIKLPQKIYLNKYILCSTIDKLNNAPQHFRIYGSLDGINWTQIVERQLTTSSYVNTLIPNSTYSTGYYTDQETKSTVAYDYYGIVVNKLLGPLDASNNKLSFSLWNIYGTNDLKGKSYFEFGVVRDTSKTVGSSLNDGLIRTNNSNIFIKSGNANTAALTIGSNNKIAIGKNIANEVLDISGSLIASEFRIINQSYPIIDSSSNIYVSGNVDISGNLTLNNDKFVINSSNGNLLIGGTLDVSKNININNNKTIIDSSGNIKSQGNFDLSNNININNNVTIDTSGSMIINNTLDISNNATLRNNLDVKGNIKSNALTTNSAINKVSIRNTSVDPSYNFHVTGNTRLEGNLDVDGNIILVDTIQQTSEQFIINNDGNSVALIVNQIGAQPIIDLRDDDQSVFYLADNGLLGLGTTTPNYTVDVSGSCYIQQTLDVSGDLIIGGNTYFSESIQLNDILDISQNLNINDKFFIDPSGNIDICGNVLIYGYLISNGNNANSGGFQQEGDANINGNLRVLYNIDISQNLRVLDTFIIDTSGNIKSKGKFDLSNNLSNSNKFSINDLGNIYSKENIDISKNFNINNGVFSADVSGNIIVNGFIDISKNLYVNGNKFSIDQNGNISSQGNIDISNNFSINNKFIVDIDGNIKSTGNLDISNNFIINGNKFKIDNSGNISSQGNFDISDNMTINNTNFTVSNTGNIKSKGTIDISNNFNINNDNFKVDNSGNIVAKGNFDILTSLSSTLSFKISQINAGTDNQTFFSKENDGSVFSCGSNVGTSSNTLNTTIKPLLGINGLGYITGITQISSGFGSLFLRGSDGAVFGIGWNDKGSLGLNNFTFQTKMQQVLGVNGIGYITGISHIYSGYYDSLFIRGDDGAVFGCGWNFRGELGINSSASQNTLQQVKGVNGNGYITGITQVSVGDLLTLFLRGSDGAVFSCGYNGHGQLGIGNTIDKSTLQQVLGINGTGYITGITYINASRYSSYLVRGIDGAVFACGDNIYGKLGINNLTSYPTLQQVKGVDGIGYITGITQVATGKYYTLFLRGSDGAVFACGENIYGQLGLGNFTNYISLQQVKGENGIGYITGITLISAGQNHSLFLRDSDGAIFSCGWNDFGNLGIGNTIHQSTLQRVLDENGNILQTIFANTNTTTYSVFLDKLNIDISGNVNSSGSLDISQNLKIGSSLLTVDYLNKRVGVNKTNPEYSLDVSGQIVTNKTILGSSSYVEVTDTNTIDTSTAIIKVNNTQITPTKITLNQYLYAFTSITDTYTFTCTEDITCDILMIGGGGGGSSYGDIVTIGGNPAVISSIRKYPPTPLSGTTDYNDTERSQGYTIRQPSGTPTYGTGNYTIYSPGWWNMDVEIHKNSKTPMKIFDGVLNTEGWLSKVSSGNTGFYYEDTVGNYYGNDFIVSDYKGEWIKLKLPVSIYLSYVKLYGSSFVPRNFKIYGSNDDGVTWKDIIVVTGNSALPFQTNDTHIISDAGVKRNTVAYNLYAIVISVSPRFASIGELEFWGSEVVTPASNSIITGGGGGGGSGALVFMKSALLPIGTYTLYVGNGGSGGVSGIGNKGGDTKITLNGTDILVAEGGGGGGGGDGGSGGGANGWIMNSNNSNTNPGIANNPGTSKIVYYGVTGIKYGNNGGTSSEYGGGGGGGAGTSGISGDISSSNRAYGGDGRTNAIINNITYDFVNVFGTNTYGINNDNNNTRYFAGGGGGYYYNITQSNIIEPVLSITPVSIDTNYKYLTFTNDGSENQITYTINFPENTECDILLVGGGGGGGQQNGGGGGAGGLVLIQNFQANGNYTIKVGKGGNGGISGGGNGGVGNNSTFVKSDNSVIITANGGGGGGGGAISGSITATNGGSGGGGGWSSVNGVQTQKSQSQIGIVSPATLNQFGEDGGHGGGDSNSYPGGGGGGAGGVGVTSTSNTTGQNGGQGIDRVGTFIFSQKFSSSIGHSGWFAGGGGSGGDGTSSGYGNGGNGLYGGGGNGTIIISNNTNYVINTKNHLSSPGEILQNTPNITRWYTYNNDVLTNVVISTDNWNVEQPGTAATTHDFTWDNNTNYLSAYSTTSTDHYGCWGVNLTNQISYSLNNITYNKHYLLIKDINAIELTTIAFKGRSDSTRDTGWLPKHFKIFGTNFNKTDITTTDITNNEWVELTEIKYKTNPYFVSFHKSLVGNINSNTFTSASINTNFDIYNWTNTTQTFNTFLFMVIDIGAQDTVMNMDQIAFRGIFGNTSSSTSVSINGINGTGGGGGSIRNSSTTSGGNGGSGIAIIRYKFTKTITTTSSINNSGKGGGGSTGIVGVANTGGGGGSGSNNPQQPGAAGGSGLILFKFNYPYIKSYNTIYNNDATFGYRNTSTTFNPAIVQLNSGQTFINSLSQYINFNFENVNKCKMDSSGNLTLNGDIFIYSDGRIKENITPITSALDKVNDLSGITYNIINKPKKQIGVIAQEVEKVLPEVIKNDGELKTVAYPNMIGLLIEALKELNDKVDQTT